MSWCSRPDLGSPLSSDRTDLKSARSFSGGRRQVVSDLPYVRDPERVERLDAPLSPPDAVAVELRPFRALACVAFDRWPPTPLPVFDREADVPAPCPLPDEDVAPLDLVAPFEDLPRFDGASTCEGSRTRGSNPGLVGTSSVQAERDERRAPRTTITSTNAAIPAVNVQTAICAALSEAHIS